MSNDGPDFPYPNPYFVAHGLPASAMCDKCGQRPGTERWVGEGGSLALIHGAYEMWCDLCVVETQLAHALKVVESIPALRARIAKLT